MKEIFFVGKMNLPNREMVTGLRQNFSVQMVTEGKKNLSEMMNFSAPALVVISLVESEGRYVEIFEYLKDNWSTIPVVTIGTTAETFAYKGYYFYTQFENLHRPVTEQQVLDFCLKKLNMSVELEVEQIIKSGKAHILIVDDNVVQLRSMKQLLDERYSVSVATSGAQAFISMGKHKPNVILLDYMMPVMNGRMALEMLRADSELKDIPVIFLTSVADKDVVEELISLKPAGYLLKPTPYDKLIDTIENVLKSR